MNANESQIVLQRDRHDKDAFHIYSRFAWFSAGLRGHTLTRITTLDDLQLEALFGQRINTLANELRRGEFMRLHISATSDRLTEEEREESEHRAALAEQTVMAGEAVQS